MKASNRENIHIGFFIAFLACVLFSLFKCRYGFPCFDEAYYLTGPYRFTMGDGPIGDEWHFMQSAYGTLVYPIMALYLNIVGSTEGLFLNFRYLYTLTHMAAALFIYFRLSKRTDFSDFSIAVAVLVYFLYVPFGIMQFSYNSMGIEGVALAGVLLATARRHLDYFWAGVFFAAAVLCCPMLIVGYAIYFVGFILFCLLKKKNPNSKLFRGLQVADDYLTPAGFTCFTLGCFLAAIAYFVLVFSRSTLHEVLVSLPWLLTDAEHPSRSLLFILFDYVKAIAGSNFLALPVCVLSIVLLGAIMYFEKKGALSDTLRKKLFLSAGLLSILFLIPFLTTDVYLNWVMFPLNIWGLFAFVLMKKRPWKLFLGTWGLGMLYSVLLTFTSNQRFYAISSVSVIALIGSILVICACSAELAGICRTRRPMTAIILAAFLLSVVGVRYQSVFWDSPIPQLTQQFQVGALKGIYTTEANVDDYMAQYLEAAPVREVADGSVIYYGRIYPHLYLEDTKPFAGFSSWQPGNTEISRQEAEAYFALHPDKLPSVIYCFKQYFPNEWTPEPIEGYSLEECELGYIFTKLS